jgi:hypothetical protein
MKKTGFFMDLQSDGQEEIANLNPAQFDIFKKSLKIIIDPAEPNKIIVRDSVMTNSTNSGAVITVDFGSLLEPGRSMQFWVSKKDISRFDQIEQKRDSVIIDDLAGDYYYLTDSIVTIRLPKVKQIIQRPDIIKIAEACALGDEISISDGKKLKKIRSFIKGSPYVDLLAYDDQVIKIKNSSQETFTFEEVSIGQYQGSPDLIFRSRAFLKIPGEDVTLKILPLNGYFWLLTQMKMAIGTNISMLENVSALIH